MNSVPYSVVSSNACNETKCSSLMKSASLSKSILVLRNLDIFSK